MKRKRPEPASATRRSAGSVTTEALARAALQRAYKMTLPQLNIVHLDRLEASLFSGGRADRLSVVDDMRRAGISAADIVDFYIPEVARKLGAQWCVDERGFAEVTIGTAHLQSMLHDITIDWLDRGITNSKDMTALIIVREGQYHTLGAMVFAAQLRRLGMTVRLLLGARDEDVVTDVRYGDDTLIGISASEGESLSDIGDLVTKLRAAAPANPLIAVGGSILPSTEDVNVLIDADYVGNDPVETLKLCMTMKTERPKGARDTKLISSLVRGI
ncbi:MAG: cobalamin B12-binding domain-containing protein [Pseudomonadota bacterium]